MRETPKYQIRDLIDTSAKPKESGSQGKFWNLNLDQIESDTGRVFDRVIVDRAELGSSTYFFDADTVLYSKLRPYLNKVTVADQPGFATTELVPLRCDISKVLPQYLAYYLRSPQFVQFATIVVAGAKMPRMVMGEFWSHEIPIPPLPEQRRIAQILDKAESLRAKRRAALAKLDTLAQSIFLEMFGDPVANPKGWPCIEFSQLLKTIDSGWSPNCQDRPVQEGEWGVLKLGAVTKCEYNPKENKALPIGIECDPTIEVKRGDLLFTRKNTYELVAACALVRETPPRLMMSDLIFRLKLKDEAPIDPVYLHRLLINPNKRSEIQKMAGGAAGSMPNISKARLLAAQIELPPLPLQQAFARRVEAIETLKVAHRASLGKLDALFASLQHRAFRGEL